MDLSGLIDPYFSGFSLSFSNINIRDVVRCFPRVRLLLAPWWPILTPNTTFISLQMFTGWLAEHYWNSLTSNIFRFTPAFTTKNDLSRFHGYDERISVKNYVQVVEFYYRLIRNSDTKLETEEVEKEGSGEMEMSGSGSLAHWEARRSESV